MLVCTHEYEKYVITRQSNLTTEHNYFMRWWFCMIFYIVIFIDTYFFEGHEVTNPAVSGVWTDRTKTFKWDY